MPDKAARLRALHHGPPILVLPNAWDAASARVFEAEGFPAIATSSAGVAAALGYPDGGVAPTREMIEAVARIARAVQVPVTADIEHAYGTTPDAVAEVVLRVIAAGAVGINIEDFVPDASELEPIPLQVDKIKTIAKATATAGVRIVINAEPTSSCARSARPKRGSAWRSIAAAPFWPRAQTACSFPACAIATRFRRSCAASTARSTSSPVKGTPPIADLEALGVARVSVGSGPMRAALAVVRDTARELKAHGTYGAFTTHALAFDEVNELMK